MVSWTSSNQLIKTPVLRCRSVEVYGQLSEDSFNAQALFQSIGKFLGVFAGAFAIGTLFGVATAIVSLKTLSGGG